MSQEDHITLAIFLKFLGVAGKYWGGVRPHPGAHSAQADIQTRWQHMH